MRPFPSFVERAEERGLHLSLVSDGFGFYIGPILESVGLERLGVITNELELTDVGPRLRHPNGHPECRGCGTCKMLAVLRARERLGPVAFVGNGESDRYSDIVFAKDALTRICERDGVPAMAWSDFDQIRTVLESKSHLPGPVSPCVCPGWHT